MKDARELSPLQLKTLRGHSPGPERVPVLRVTADAFSGRRNPSAVLVGAIAEEFLAAIDRRPGMVHAIDSGATGLGFRGLIVERLSAHTARTLPPVFRVAGGAARDEDGGKAFVEDALKLMARADPTLKMSRQLQRALVKSAHSLSTSFSQPEAQNHERRRFEECGPCDASDSRAVTVEDPGPDTRTLVDSFGAIPSVGFPNWLLRELFVPHIELEPSVEDLAYWNEPTTAASNNCYEYASNCRTDRLAVPGSGNGFSQHIDLPFGRHELERRLFADGCRPRHVPQPEWVYKERYLIALAIWPLDTELSPTGSPSPDICDFHFYRRLRNDARGGHAWGHKPGRRLARITDERGRPISDPETCDRGDYGEFGGYFYTNRMQYDRLWANRNLGAAY